VRLVLRAFHVPKEGEDHEYQDAYAPSIDTIPIESYPFYAAISDGASESIHSGIWAQLLVKAYIDSRPNTTDKKLVRMLVERKASPEWARQMREKYPDLADWATERFTWDKFLKSTSNWTLNWKDTLGADWLWKRCPECGNEGKPGYNMWANYCGDCGARFPVTPWYIGEALRKGSFATFLGIELHKKKLKVVCWGDSCLFHVREDHSTTAFPVQGAELFSNTPDLVCSNPEQNQKFWEGPAVKFAQSSWHRGDSFVLTTDALAKWFLTQAQQGKHPEDEILNMMDLEDPHFPEWVAQLKINSQLVNDDITLLVLKESR